MPGRLGQFLVSRVLDPIGHWLDAHADWLVGLILHQATRTLAAWLVAGVTAWIVLSQAWHAFDAHDGEEGLRPDGNHGHCTIDFGGQWMMGAMLVHGKGRQLYNRHAQRELLRQAYPVEHQAPRAKQDDADALMSYFMGGDDRWQQPAGSLVAPLAAADPWQASTLVASCRPYWTRRQVYEVLYPIGGPLYPPINALVYAPLGALPPHVGYRLNQILNLVWAFLAALGVRYLTHGRIWVAVAATLIMIYPGFKGSIHLGQNATLTLMLLVWGWALMARERPILGGLVWGLLAFKPVWAAAFFLVPFLTCRWRSCLAMLGMGGSLALLTVPWVGWRPWLDWFWVGQEAAELYKVDYNWVFLSRDVLGIPRRWLLDFSLPADARDVPLAGIVGWTLFGTFLLGTIGLALLRPRQARAAVGAPAAFLLLGAWLSCFHFMYYDVLLTALPMFVLLAEPNKLLEPKVVALVPLPTQPALDDLMTYYGPWPADQGPPLLPLLQPTHRHVWVLNHMVPNVLAALLVIEHGLPYVDVAGTMLWWPRPYRITTQDDGPGTTRVALQQRSEPMTTTRDRDGNPILDLPLRAAVTLREEDEEAIVHRRVGYPATVRLSTRLYDDGEPWDTYCMIFLWSWCGLLWLRMSNRLSPRPATPIADVVLVDASGQPAQLVELASDVAGGHERFAHEDRSDARRAEP